MYEAIGLVEVTSIAFGIEVADAMIKAAPVRFIDTYMVTPGKYIVLVHGDPSSVESSLETGRATAADRLLDSLSIPNIHPQVFRAIRRQHTPTDLAALGLIETSTVASGIVAADCAAKAAQVDLLQLDLARGIGGKSILMFTGKLHDVEAALEAGSAQANQEGSLVATRKIANPHEDLVKQIRTPGQTA